MPNITPKPISGFPELLPEQQLVFNRCLDIIRANFELFGFAPIETPSVERKEVLTSKGANEKEIYALARLMAGPGESSETDVALHFDLTVPLARYVAQWKDKLVFPFRRYQMQKVWRGERAQSGRYREFYQCDIDVIGRGVLGLVNDAEIPSIIYRIFSQMAIGRFVVRINNRRLLQGYFEHAGVATADVGEVLRIVDRLDKVGRERVLAELIAVPGVSEPTAARILEFIGTELGTDSLLAMLDAHDARDNPRYQLGLAELRAVVEGIRSLGVPEQAFAIDLRIARGLDYYTGTVYETLLVDHPDLGSICSGGRYDDLASHFTNEKLPGVGISIGLSRLLLRLIETGVLKNGPSTPASVLVTTMDPQRIAEYLRMAADLRDAGIRTEVYLEKKSVGDQLKFAARKGHVLAVIAGDSEFLANIVNVKHLSSGHQVSANRAEIVAAVRAALAGQ